MASSALQGTPLGICSFLILLALFPCPSLSAALRGASIAWTVPDPDASPLTVRFEIQTLWVLDSSWPRKFDGSSSIVVGGRTQVSGSAISEITELATSGLILKTGDGNSYSLDLTVTWLDGALFSASSVVHHTYQAPYQSSTAFYPPAFTYSAGVGTSLLEMQPLRHSPWNAVLMGCCRDQAISALGSRSFTLRTSLDLTDRDNSPELLSPLVHALQVGTAAAQTATLSLLFRDHFHVALDGQQATSKSGGTSHYPPDDSRPAPLTFSIMNSSETLASWPFGAVINPSSGLLSLTVWSANSSGSNVFAPGLYPIAVRACLGSACSVVDLSVAVLAASTCSLPSISIATISPPSALPLGGSIASWPGYAVSFDVYFTWSSQSSSFPLLYSLDSSPFIPLSPQNPVAVTPLNIDGSISIGAGTKQHSLRVETVSMSSLTCITDIALSYNNPAGSVVDGPFSQPSIEFQNHPEASRLLSEGFTMRPQGFTGVSSIISYVWTRSLNSSACITDIRLIAPGAGAAAATAAAVATGFTVVPATTSSAASSASIIMIRRGQTQAITAVEVILQANNATELISRGYQLVSGFLDSDGAPTLLYLLRQPSRMSVRRFTFTPTSNGIIPVSLVAQGTSFACNSAYSTTTFAASVFSDGGSAFVDSDWQAPLVATMGNVSQFHVRFVSQPLTQPIIQPATHDFTGVWVGYCEQFAALDTDETLMCASQACRQSYTIEYAAGRTRYQSLDFMPGSLCTSKDASRLKPQLLNPGSLHDVNLQPFSVGKSLKQGSWFYGVPVSVRVDGLGCYAAWTNGSHYQEQGNYDSAGNYKPGCPDCSGSLIGTGSCSNDGSLSCGSDGFNYRCFARLDGTIKTTLAFTERILSGAIYQRLAPVPMPNGLLLHTLSVRWDVGPLLSGFKGSVCFSASQPSVGGGAFTSPLATGCLNVGSLVCLASILLRLIFLQVEIERCVWQARDSDSFSTIASRFPPANWLQVWFMNPSVLHPDSALKQNDRVIVGKEYIVEANDSLQSIAKRFGTTAEEILRINADLVHNAPLVPGSTVCVISKPCAFAN